MANRRIRFPGIGFGVLLAIVLVLSTGQALAENARLSLPKSGLEQPSESPIFLAGHASVGFGGAVDGLRPGGGASFVLLPGNAERFLPILQGWNTALVLQAEYHRINDTQRILSGGALFRRYFGPVDSAGQGPVFFAGPGVGASEVELAGGGFEKGWEWLVEAGQQWRPRHDRLVFWQLEYRWYDHHGQDFSHWSVKVGAGLPWPF